MKLIEFSAEDIQLLLYILIALLVLLTAFSIISFLFSFGLFRIAKNEKLENAWLAWIPVGQNFLMIELIQEKNKIKNLKWIFPILVGVTSILFIIPFLNIILLLACLVFHIYICHLFFEKYTDKKWMLTTFNLISLGIIGLLSFFFLRNVNTKGD